MLITVGLLALLLMSALPAAGQSDAKAPTLEDRLKLLEAELAKQQARNSDNEAKLKSLTGKLEELEKTKPAPATPATGPAGRVLSPDDPETRERLAKFLREMTADPEFKKELTSGLRGLDANYRQDNDFQGSGFTIQSPGGEFRLQMEGRAQFRYTYYNQLDRSNRDGRLDRTGTNRDIRSDFEINRLLLDAGGHVFKKTITYRFQPIASTNSQDAFLINQAFLNWNVLGDNKDVPAFWRDALQIRAGEFLTTFGRWETNGNAWGGQIPTDFQLMDRPLAVQAFKPDRSLGVELHGVLGGVPEGLPENRPGTKGVFQYIFAINNGFNAAGQRYGLDLEQPRQTDKYPSLVARGVFDVLKGRYTGLDDQDYYLFGRNQSDLEHHENLALQVGGSVAWQRTRGQASPADNARLGQFYRPEPRTNTARGGGPLPVDQPGSDAFRWGADVAWKYRGWSTTAEFYYQHLVGINNERANSRNQTQDGFGFYVTSGYFVVPRKLELVGGVSGIFAPSRPSVPRGTFLAGTDGSGVDNNWQFTGGLNYFPFSSQKMKLSLDATYLMNPSVNVPTSGFVASSRENAWELRAQVQFGF